MKILCMLPAAEGVYPKEAEERRMTLMRSYSNAATQVDAAYMPDVSGFVPWGGGEQRGGEAGGWGGDASARAAEFSAQLAARAEQDGYDAFCPFGGLDIGVKEARARVKIPVVGQTEACYLFCGLLGQKFANVVYMPGAEAPRHREAEAAGVGDQLVGVFAIGIPNSEYPQRRGDLLREFVRCANEAKAAGAALIGRVAMSICPTEYSAKELTEASGMPVLDALACQIAMAEWWHRTQLPTSLLRLPR